MHLSPTILDSTAPLSFIAKNGYYTIGNAIANHHGTAIQEATRTGLPIKWHFNEAEYSAMNWRQRWNIPITEVYRMRAQQLRDKYDYLILWFSGGADSTTILESFVLNNIHLDEVMIAWPVSQTQGRYTPNTEINQENFISEWDFSIKPRLEWLAKHYPQVKITVLDQMKTVRPVEDFEDTWTIIEKHNFVAIQRQRDLDAEIVNRVEQYGNVASIAGVAPPLVSVVNERYLATVFGSHYASAGIAKSDYIQGGIPRNVEAFYWTPDMPEIVREQAHLILDHLHINHSAKALFLPYDLVTGKLLSVAEANHEARRRLIKSLVYPNWDPNIFQALKPTDHLDKNKNYNWFFSNPESSKYLESWRSSMNSQYALIDPKFFKQKDNTFVTFSDMFISKFYPIGRIQD